jgi:ubiquinone/menaquinone biosynthesis C-methylase UbiE
VLDHNRYFEKYFSENKSKFPHINCEEFLNGNAKDMNQIKDESMAVVVATYLLCSVEDRDRTLKEIKWVLKKVDISILWSLMIVE